MCCTDGRSTSGATGGSPRRPQDAAWWCTSTTTLAEPDFTTVPSELRILVVNGADDPVGGEEGGRALADELRRVGGRDVSFRAYPGGRHELLNETNREEVTNDLLAW